ncbi:MAG TPA: molybdopterin-dependent oxidoreductase [Anaerolineales bacterium]|nr:molybdopterin-dependent oxidoreductase [Anaerolineales bacterium]
MKHKKRVLVSILLLLSLLLSACGGGTPKVDWELKVSGAVNIPLSLSFQELAEMNQVDLKDVKMEKSTGEDEITSWSGVPLSEIFTKAGVTDYSTITAVAADGYAIEISKDELADGIVALKDKGEWIAEVTPDKGPIRLVNPKTPGNRWVFALREIVVNP